MYRFTRECCKIEVMSFYAIFVRLCLVNGIKRYMILRHKPFCYIES